VIHSGTGVGVALQLVTTFAVFIFS
jgi:hypothetical protein